MDKERFLAFYEEAGYRVVDSFAYSDIKLFLMRNRPKITYRVLYGVIMLFILLGIGLMIGGLWKQAGEAGQFWLETGGSLIFALVGCALLIPVHEFIHWLVYRSEGAADVRFGAIWHSFAFYAAAHNFLADYKTFKRIALAPLYLLSALLLLLLLFPMPLWGKVAVALVLLFHLSSCSGDLMMLAYMSRYKHRRVFTVDDMDNQVTYFLEKQS